MANEPLPPSESMYPEVEALVENAGPADIGDRFSDLRAALDGLKGPRAEQAKKVRKGLDRVEELLRHLVQVRQDMASKDSKSRK